MDISQKQIEFNKRCLYCMQEMRAINLIPSMKSLVLEAGLSYTRYTEMDRVFRQGRGNMRYKTIEFDLINLMVEKYGVSADWLITGRGSMFYTAINNK